MTSRRRTLLALVVAAAAIAVAGAACGDDGDDDAAGDAPPPGRACTLIACSSGVTIEVAELPAGARRARVCVGGECGRAREVSRPGFFTAKLPRTARRDAGRVRIGVELLARDGQPVGRAARRARVRRTRPNGPDCPPVCYQANLRLELAGGAPRLRPAPR